MELAPPVSKALDKLKIRKPTPVQSAVMPLVMDGRDVLASAHTGSGKTVAFVLPLVVRLSERASPYTGTRALILAPTRELARQIHSVCETLGNPVQVQSVILTGGASFKEQDALLRKSPDIVIATPGRLQEHLDRQSLDLDDLQCVVLDEADRMLDLGFQGAVQAILDRCPQERQTLLFSATLEHSGVKALAEAGLSNPETVALNEARSVPEHITQSYVLADDVAFKTKLTDTLIKKYSDQQVMIFTNTIVKAQSLQSRLSGGDFRCALLHGDMTQDGRNAVIGGMRDGRYRVLVTTDVAARGLDLPNVGLVINFDLARKGDEYLHRVGRTGRAGQPGRAISLIGPQEWNRMISIQNYLKTELAPMTVPGLKSSYQGPERLRKSGKAYGKKKKPGAGKKMRKAVTADKAKARERVLKNKGKKRARPEAEADAQRDGSSPLKRKPKTDNPEQAPSTSD